MLFFTAFTFTIIRKCFSHIGHEEGKDASYKWGDNVNQRFESYGAHQGVKFLSRSWENLVHDSNGWVQDEVIAKLEEAVRKNQAEENCKGHTTSDDGCVGESTFLVIVFLSTVEEECYGEDTDEFDQHVFPEVTAGCGGKSWKFSAGAASRAKTTDDL